MLLLLCSSLVVAVDLVCHGAGVVMCECGGVVVWWCGGVVCGGVVVW